MAAAELLTAAQEDYLEAIYVLAPAGTGARMGDIAKHVDVHKSTVTAALHSLAKRGLVEYHPYKPVVLTPGGKRIAAQVLRRHETLCRFLTDVLAVEGRVAENTACEMEHVVPPSVIERFTAFTNFMESRPQEGERFLRELGLVCTRTSSHGGRERCVEATENGPCEKESGGEAH